ncbi:HNH endonuclease [Pseudomonas luteola]
MDAEIKSENVVLEGLFPRELKTVYQLVCQLGMDTTEWEVKENGQKVANPSTNTWMSSRWAFMDKAGVIMVCLWHDEMKEDQKSIIYEDNMKLEIQKYERHRSDLLDRNRQKETSESRSLIMKTLHAQQMDKIINEASRTQANIRVAIVRRTNEVSGVLDTSVAGFRMLDPEPWHIQSYNVLTGAYRLVRGARPTLPPVTADSYGIEVDDQFIGSTRSSQYEVNGNVYYRDPKVRQKVLMRSEGKCEHCGAAGFLKANGKVYLETHHIKALSEGGQDVADNMIALCANDHRESHYGANKESLAESFLMKIRFKRSAY